MHNYSTRLGPTPYLLQSNIAQILGHPTNLQYSKVACVQPPPPPAPSSPSIQAILK